MYNKYIVGLLTLILQLPFASAQTNHPFTNTPTNPPSGGQLPQGVVGRTGTPTNVYPTSIYSMPEVAKHLNLTPDQVNSLNAIDLQTQRMHQNNYATLNTLNGNERMTKNDTLDQHYMNDWYTNASKVMNPTQWNRYRQLNNQYQGFNALTNSDIQKQMNLTPTQIENLNKQRTWSNDQLQEINKIGAVDPARGQEMYQNYWKERSQRLGSFLTPDQQKQWATLSGDPFTFKPQFNSQR